MEDVHSYSITPPPPHTANMTKELEKVEVLLHSYKRFRLFAVKLPESWLISCKKGSSTVWMKLKTGERRFLLLNQSNIVSIELSA